MLRRISENDSRLICAQQVILDLSKCVKELVENSLDAGATQVEIKLRRYGLNGIEVSDNGHGIQEVDHATLMLGHSTSKIVEYADLEGVQSFGFRGEALSAICSLGNVTVLTCSEASSSLGHRLTYGPQGNLLETVPCARQRGTTVTVQNLFKTLAVRWKDFERNCKREYQKCIQLLQEYALLAVGVRLSVVHFSNASTRQLVLATKGDSLVKDNIVATLGSKLFHTLIPLDFEFDGPETDGETSTISVSGYISKPVDGCGRSTGDRQYYFVHYRPCSFPKISRGINETYRNILVGQVPAFVLNLKLPKGSFDINVTPDKRTILLHDETHVLERFQEKLVELFEPYADSVELAFPSNTRLTTIPATPRPPDVTETVTQNVNPLVEEPSQIRDVDASPISILKQSLSRVQELFSGSAPVNPAPPPLVQARPIFQSAKSGTINLSEGVISRCRDSSSKTKAQRIVIYENTAKNRVPRTPESEKVPTISSRSSLSSQKTPMDFAAMKRRLQEKSRKKTAGDTSTIKNTTTEAPDFMDPEAETLLRRKFEKSQFKELKLIGQFNKGFILAMMQTDMDKDIFILDQHATDEKYLFEKYSKESRLETQPLVCPKRLELPADQLLTILENEDVFFKNGFKVDVIDDGEQRIARLLSLPVLQGRTLTIADFEELLALVQDAAGNKSDLRCSKVRSVFASRACRTAFMMGDSLTRKDMRSILDNLAGLAHPWNCPHGRPTLRWLHRQST